MCLFIGSWCRLTVGRIRSTGEASSGEISGEIICRKLLGSVNNRASRRVKSLLLTGTVGVTWNNCMSILEWPTGTDWTDGQTDTKTDRHRHGAVHKLNTSICSSDRFLRIPITAAATISVAMTITPTTISNIIITNLLSTTTIENFLYR